jgi:hypothetical protein
MAQKHGDIAWTAPERARLPDFVIAEHARVMLLPRMSRYAMLMRSDRRLLLTSLAAVAATSLIAPNAHACTLMARAHATSLNGCVKCGANSQRDASGM